jgi:tetratricopeptide (TPR) repeat protein
LSAKDIQGSSLSIEQVTELYKSGEHCKAEAKAYDLYLQNSDNRKVKEAAFLIAITYAKELYEARRYDELLEVSRRCNLYDGKDYLPYYYRGLALAKLKRLDEAKTEMKGAKDLCPPDISSANISWSLANIAYDQGAFDEAVTGFREVMLSGKNTANLVYKLATSLWRSGDTPSAIAVLKEGRLDFPESQSIARLIDKYERENVVEEDFRQVRSGDFFISFERSDEQTNLKDRLSKILAIALKNVERNLWSHEGNMIHVVLYPSGQEFIEALNAPNWSAACWNGKLRIPLETARSAREEKLLPLLSHELVHFLLREKYKWQPLPCWIDEGLAQVYEGEEKPWAKNILRSAVNRKNSESFLFSLKQLEVSFSNIRSGNSARMAYAQSLWLTKYLLERRWSYPTDILDYIANGYTAEEALTKVTGEDYEAFTEAWLKWVRKEFNLREQ